MVLAPTDQMKNTKYYELHGAHCEGMDVLAVREATRFAIDYCSVQAKVTLTHNVNWCHLASVTGSTCLWNFHLPVSWTLNVWSWNQLPHQVEYDNWPWPLFATTALKCHNCLLMPPVPIQVFKNTFLLQGRSSGDAKDKRPNHRVPRSHHWSRACRDFWDQGHRAWSETKCWCGCEESQGKSGLPLMVSQIDLFFSQQSDGEIGEEELYFDIYENNLGGKVYVSLKYHLRNMNTRRWGAFSQRTCTSTRKLNRLSTFKGWNSNSWVWPGGRIIKAYHMFLWPSVELTCFQRNYWATI